jgi:hypothetical protein
MTVQKQHSVSMVMPTVKVDAPTAKRRYIQSSGGDPKSVRYQASQMLTGRCGIQTSDSNKGERISTINELPNQSRLHSFL